MHPPFNSFRPQAHPHRPQQQQNNGYSNQHQHNGFQNQVNSNQHQHNGYHNQFGMMNPQMMSNPVMGHMNNPIPMPNIPIHPPFFNNMPQQQQQLNQFAFPNNIINPLLPSLLNLQFAVANSNLMGPLVQPNIFRPCQPQLNSFNSLSYPPAPNPNQNHQLQPRPQGIVNNNNGYNSNGNGVRNKFTKHQKFKGHGQVFQRSQHQPNNAKKKCNKDQMGKGNDNKMATGLDDAGNIAKEKKRSYGFFYTPKEIKQWREARRKHFPTKLSAEKKAKKNISECTVDEEAIMRRQQLQEVLAKQAELGVEVAEVPSHYLSNTEDQLNGERGDNNGESLKGNQFQYKDGKKGRFQNNRHKKRRHGDKDKLSKKPRFEDKNSPQESSVITREPMLREKLLSTDIKREKSQLLQVFRFMVMNSFFKEFPEQPLKLPLVMVEETGCEHDREDPSDEILSDDDDGDSDDNSCDEALER
ncbi:hypothetical protein AALP_AA8G200500 [Arabis alpina]|uniref:FMR1-interacting protein 1 conserved domain-containing protein n=1 Tax=Arabis alpina TaxID=50452 RepID=A0A087G880_ARAAL|nr:hypothetical protein AALP_AA8G200500 [Arabis alpina]